MTSAPRHVVVVGGGVAGLAAAWSAKRAGARVTLLHGKSGASALYSGALDFRATATSSTSAQLVLFASALGGWKCGAGPYRVATETGLCRSVDGCDSALLDLEPHAGGKVAVVDALHTSWDARLVARELAASEWATRSKTQISVLPLPDLLKFEEQAVPFYDLALRFDDPTRFKTLCDLLVATRGDANAILLGPWLGLETDVTERATAALGVAIGETTSTLGGVAGARFERARDRLLLSSEIDVQIERVERVEPTDLGFVIQLGSGELTADSVVLAIGGVAAGGILLDDARPDHPGGACFHTSLQAPVSLHLDGDPVEHVSTLHGVDFCLAGLGTLERVGIAARHGRTDQPGLYVAGDCVANGPRTALDAATSGIAVGALAAEANASVGAGDPGV